VNKLQQGAFYCLEFILLGYQHSPELFHSLLPYLPALFQYLQTVPMEQEITVDRNKTIDFTEAETI
jgi:hypothetical protein